MTTTYYNPEPFKSVGRPYSMAVLAGQTVYMSGQLPVEVNVDGKRSVVGVGDAAAQVDHIFRNMDSVLRGLGGTLQNICWLQFFMTDMEDRLRIDAVRRKWFPSGDLPASTLVEVRRLAEPLALVEINAIAHLDSPPTGVP